MGCQMNCRVKPTTHHLLNWNGLFSRPETGTKDPPVDIDEPYSTDCLRPEGVLPSVGVLFDGERPSDLGKTKIVRRDRHNSILGAVDSPRRIRPTYDSCEVGSRARGRRTLPPPPRPPVS